MSAKIIAVDEQATSRMLAACSSAIPKLPQGMRALFVGQYCMAFVALTALALFRPSRPACLRNG
jgi:hypothetical protein